MPKGPRKRPGQTRDSLRPSAAERGYNYAWQQYRKVYLKDHPLCVRHLRRGRIVPATVVDHIRPHRGDDHWFWLETNHQSLCAGCHNVKTATEDGGFGHAIRPQTKTNSAQVDAGQSGQTPA